MWDVVSSSCWEVGTCFKSVSTMDVGISSSPRHGSSHYYSGMPFSISLLFSHIFTSSTCCHYYSENIRNETLIDGGQSWHLKPQSHTNCFSWMVFAFTWITQICKTGVLLFSPDCTCLALSGFSSYYSGTFLASSGVSPSLHLGLCVSSIIFLRTENNVSFDFFLMSFHHEIHSI